MAGRDLLVAAPAPRAWTKKGKNAMIAVVSVLALLYLTAAAGWLACYIGRESFVKVCVFTHVTNMCLLAWVAATAPTPAARRFFMRSIVRSAVHLKLILYFVLVVCRAEVEDTA